MRFFSVRAACALAILMAVCGGVYLADALAEEKEAHASEGASVALFDIPSTLEQITTKERQVRSELDSLPRLSEPLQFDAYGYHGGYLPALSELPDTSRWTVDVNFFDGAQLSQIILVPAIDHRFGYTESYGFPKRFRISQVFKDGRTKVVKEWMNSDCPVPGRMPIMIDLPNPRGNIIRIEVFQGAHEDNKEFFALDEVFGIAKDEIFRAETVTASSNFESRPYWASEFLIDHQTSLGLPIGKIEKNNLGSVSDDFSIVFDTPPQGPCVVELDLGKNGYLGWITLFPATPKEGILIPGYGFPGKIEFKMVRETPKGKRGKIIQIPGKWTSGNPGNNVVRIGGFSKGGRWMRLIMSDFPVHNGESTFAMGEINIFQFDKPYLIKAISLQGFPAEAKEIKHRLIDRQSRGRPIMFLLQWLHQVKHQNKLSQEQEQLTHQATLLNLRWKQFWIRTGMGLASVLLLVSVYIATSSILQRQRRFKVLRRQINSDLHDDIGSKVAAITLASTYVERMATEESVQERGSRIQVIAQSMHHALRDVLWLTDTQTDTLNQVVQKLADSSRIHIDSERLNLEMTPMRSIPARPVSVQTKRDLLLFFKEALQNASSHSKASLIDVKILMKGRNLTLTVKDNGIGINSKTLVDSPEPSSHYGLQSMHTRSKRLHGKLSIDSKPNQGTTVKLHLTI